MKWIVINQVNAIGIIFEGNAIKQNGTASSAVVCLWCYGLCMRQILSLCMNLIVSVSMRMNSLTYERFLYF